jgi:hypothetical protein
MNAKVNTGNTYSSTDSRIKTKNVETLWKNIHWSSKKWQFFCRRLFWTPNIYHWDRCLNVAFYVNGLNLVKFEEWYNFQGLVGNDAVYKHLQVLFRSFRNRHCKLNAWHVGNNKYEYIDGKICRNVHEILR